MVSRWHVAVVRSLTAVTAALCAVGLIHGIADAGTLDVSWTAPTTTVTGMPLTNLAGYRVYYGTASAGCPGATYVTVPSSTSTPSANQTLTWTLLGLTAGTPYYVAVTAVDALGAESSCVTAATATVARSDFSVTPTTVSFGAVTVGSFADQTFTVQNGGQTAISGSAAASSPFSVVAGSPYSLAPGDQTTVTVRFSPSAAASATSNVAFSMGNSGTVSRVVSGIGAATPSSAQDTTAPTISLTAPASGAVVSGAAVVLTATATDNVGVVGVQFMVNGRNLGSEITTPPWRISWYTLSTPDGTQTLSAVARDAAGNRTTAVPVSVKLANTTSTSTPVADTTPPTVSIISPAPFATTASSTVGMSGIAVDNVGVTQVSWTNSRGGSGTASGTTSWTASGIPLLSGTNVITVTARDAAGNSGQSSLTVVKTDVDTTPPTVSITSPAATSTTAASTLTVSGTAADNVGVTQVSWTSSRGGSGSASGTTSWAANGIPLLTGVNVITVTARDAAGNVAQSAVTVTKTDTTVTNTPPALPGDTTPPTVAILSPTTTTTGSSTLAMSGIAVDNVGVTQVSWTSNRGAGGTASGTTSWTANNIPLLAGANVITVIAWDAAGNIGRTSMTITKTDTTAPIVSLTAPYSGAVVSGAVTLAATAIDDVGVVGVQFKVDGVNVGSEVTTPPYQTSWSTLSTANGTHTLTAVARDAAGNTATSGPLTVMLSNSSAAPTTPVTVPVSNPTPASGPVAYDNSVSSGFQWGVTSVTTPAFVVGSGANRAAMIMVAMAANNATNITASLGGVAATLIPGTDTGTSSSIRTLIFQVLNPPSGLQTARVSWTTAMHADVGVVTVTGADQTTPTANGRFTAFGASPTAATSVTIPSNPGDLTASVGFTTNQWVPSATNQTFVWGPSSSPVQGDRGAGVGTTTHTWTGLYAGTPRSVSGANFVAARPQ